jgi:flagellar hook-associated protein 2
MGSSLAIDGLISGLKTTELINSLMSVEAVPQTLLKRKVSESQGMITALQSINAKVASLNDMAAKLAKPVSFDVYSATSSSPKVTVTAGAGAAPAQLDITVQAVAQAQKSVSAAMTAWPDSPPVLTIQRADGTTKTITAATTSLDDVVSAVNKAGAGITATKVAVGGGNFKIQFTSTTVGAAGAFTVHQGNGTATPLPTTQVQAAQDASITIWAGTPSAQVVTSTKNTFDQVLPGVSITVGAVSADPITISVGRDDAAITKNVGGLVTDLNAIFAEIQAKSAVSTSTDASGSTVVKGGVFTGDSAIRDVHQRLLSAASAPINGKSPSEFGISITKSGTMEFDAEKFQKALVADPAATQAAVQTIAGRIAAAAKTTSDKFDGTLTTKITGQQSEVRSLGQQVDDWDRRLASRRSTLETTYSKLEVQLSNLNAQQSYIMSQLSGLSTQN